MASRNEVTTRSGLRSQGAAQAPTSDVARLGANSTSASPAPAKPKPPMAAQIPELLIQIFTCALESTSPERRTPTLANIVLVCRSWHAVANSWLYQEIEINWHYSRAQAFIRTLDANSVLIDVITSFTARSFRVDWEAAYHRIKGAYLNSEEFFDFLEEMGFEEAQVEKYGSKLISSPSTEREAVEKVLYAKMMELPDGPWMLPPTSHPDNESKKAKAIKTLFELIKRLTNLRHLSLVKLDELKYSPRLWREACQGTLGRILSGLDSLELRDVSQSLAQLVLKAAWNVTSLKVALRSNQADSELNFPRLRHLSISLEGPDQDQPRYGWSRHQANTLDLLMAPFFFAVNSLHTLSISFLVATTPWDVPLFSPAVLREINKFPVLSHFHLHHTETSPNQVTLDSFRSFCALAPNLRHFFVTSPSPLRFIEVLPETTTHIDIHSEILIELALVRKSVEHLPGLVELVFGYQDLSGVDWDESQEKQGFSRRQRDLSDEISLKEVIRSWECEKKSA